MSVWHPLWLPKLVLDGYEEKTRAKMRQDNDPRADDDSYWGNDGIVTVQSSQWGEFLGVLNGCDHWEIRGARGLEFSDFQDLNLGLSVSDALDWRKLIGLKKEKETATTDAGKGIKAAAEKHEKRSEHAEEKDKDKLSTVMDWLSDKVPSPPKLPSNFKALTDRDATKKEPPQMINELETKEDLERFYIALTRKLYDEGL